MKSANSLGVILNDSACAGRKAARVFLDQLVRSAALILVACICLPAGAQTGEWVWMGGSSTIPADCNLNSEAGCGQPGVYGTPGSFTAGSVPGSRDGAVSWTDASGNLWIFGGFGYDVNDNFGFLNDFWEFSTSLNAWAWMGGSSTVPDVNHGQPGQYGSTGTAATGNIPAARSGAAGWIDTSGNFWLFGGAGDDTDYSVDSNGNNLNDLWMYSPTSGLWAWMGGDAPTNSQPDFAGTYGTPGDFTSGAFPGSRNFATTGTDASGNFWLFGGNGQGSTVGAADALDDLWEFNPTTNQWAWISGSSTTGDSGSYGTLQAFASGNGPCSRYGASMWTDSSGDLWLFGGFGFPPNGEGYLNDLWEYNPTLGTEGEWAWMAGNNTMGTVTPPAGSQNAPGSGWIGIYGTSGVAASGNNPGSRIYASTWTDSSGNLWLFGGDGFDSAGNNGDLNDLWEFSPATYEWAWMGGSDLADQPGVYQSTAGSPGGGAIVSAYANSGVLADSLAATTSYDPGSRHKAASWKDKNGNLWLMGGSGVDSSGSAGYLNDRWEYQLSKFKLGLSSTSTTIQSGGQGTITVTITPQNGFSSAVSFACSGQPSGASCDFSQNPVTPSGGAAATTTLTYHAQTLSAALRPNSRPFLPGTVLALCVCVLGWRKRRGLQLLLLLAVTAAGLGLISGCGSGGAAGGGGGGGSVAPVTSTITVTATSGSIQQSTTISITVD